MGRRELVRFPKFDRALQLFQRLCLDTCSSARAKLPIVENGQLLGLVTLTDLIRSKGVVEFLNGLSLNGVSPRLKKAMDIYFDAEQSTGQAKKLIRRCPLIMKDGFSVSCAVEKCMWWTGEECAISQISRHLQTIQIDGLH